MKRDLHSQRYRKLRELLITARMEAQVTQTELAKRIGRTQSFIADYERAERRLDVIDYLTVAEAIGTDPLELLSSVLLAKRDLDPEPF